MIKQERKEVIVSTLITAAYICDICGAEHIGDIIPNNWHEFSHHHSGWGNDSCDSIEHFQVCSPKCYAIRIRESIKEVGEYGGAEIDGLDIPFAQNLSDSILKEFKNLPDFLYERNGEILTGYHGDEVVTEEWDRWKKEVGI